MMDINRKQIEQGIEVKNHAWKTKKLRGKTHSCLLNAEDMEEGMSINVLRWNLLEFITFY